MIGILTAKENIDTWNDMSKPRASTHPEPKSFKGQMGWMEGSKIWSNRNTTGSWESVWHSPVSSKRMIRSMEMRPARDCVSRNAHRVCNTGLMEEQPTQKG